MTCHQHNAFQGSEILDASIADLKIDVPDAFHLIKIRGQVSMKRLLLSLHRSMYRICHVVSFNFSEIIV